MKTLYITFTCLILLVGQVALGYAAVPDVEGEVVPRPEGGSTSWGIPLTSVERPLLLGTPRIGDIVGVSSSWNKRGRGGRF